MADIANPGQLLGAIFSASPDAVVVIDGSGRIMLSSPAVSDLFGYFPEELVGEPLEVLIPTDRRTRHVDHIRRFFDSPVARQMGAGLQLAGRRRDGTTFAVDVSLTPSRFVAPATPRRSSAMRGSDKGISTAFTP